MVVVGRGGNCNGRRVNFKAILIGSLLAEARRTPGQIGLEFFFPFLLPSKLITTPIQVGTWQQPLRRGVRGAADLHISNDSPVKIMAIATSVAEHSCLVLGFFFIIQFDILKNRKPYALEKKTWVNIFMKGLCNLRPEWYRLLAPSSEGTGWNTGNK